MGWIILLIVLGVVLFFAELVLLPGITIAAAGAFCCLVVAAAWTFVSYGVFTGFVVLAIILVILGVMMALFLRRRTWHNMSLHTEIKESIARPIEELVAVGALGIAHTRLAPMGNVLIEGKVYEAKTFGEFLDAKSHIEVIGYDNQALIVKGII
ncbi:MAG: serine protease [Mucinivorans sp.]